MTIESGLGNNNPTSHYAAFELSTDSWHKGHRDSVLAVGNVVIDESIRPGTNRETLATLRPAYIEGGTLTAGNSSPINDSAAAMILASERLCVQRGLTAQAELLGSTTVAIAPDRFAEAPALATRRLLDRHTLAPAQIDVWEVNEAFAAVVLAYLREFDEITPEQVNTEGGAIALGHPLGASMTRVIADTVDHLTRRGGGLGVASACIGVGQGMAVLISVDH